MKYSTNISNAAKKCFLAGKKFWGECCEAENIVAAARVTDIRAQQAASMRGDYELVANIVCILLSGNHARVGLAYPNQIEEIFAYDSNNAIQISQTGMVIFTYEIDRIGSDAFVGGMKRLECPAVPSSVIADIFEKRFPIYANRRGYYFNAITVDDIPDNRVRISLYGVRRVIPQI